ncbi:unnamed protein product, partial [Musa textilis]
EYSEVALIATVTRFGTPLSAAASTSTLSRPPARTQASLRKSKRPLHAENKLPLL